MAGYIAITAYVVTFLVGRGLRREYQLRALDAPQSKLRGTLIVKLHTHLQAKQPVKGRTC